MNALLWTLQIVLALVFTAAGAIKLIKPRELLLAIIAAIVAWGRFGPYSF
jgi:hypothetical protein